ncbi:solute carrier family 23 protein [Peribacillus frigoritolerans]|nr:solute carrier family 23 protein [Peribacillus frigoritolerans]
MPKVAGLTTMIPLPVLGGAMIPMFGMLLSAALGMVAKADLSKPSNQLTIALRDRSRSGNQGGTRKHSINSGNSPINMWKRSGDGYNNTGCVKCHPEWKNKSIYYTPSFHTRNSAKYEPEY